MASKKLFVAVPVYGSLEPNFTLCLIRLITEKPCNLGLSIKNGDSLVPRARNALVAQFLASDCTDLLFIDSDLIFTPQHVARIISHDKDVVGGFYIKKMQGIPQFVCNTFENCEPPDADGLQKVKYMGTGFLKISRKAFETIIAKFGEKLWYHPDETPPETKEHDLFTTGVYQFPDGTRRYLSEDWFFCQRWLDCGGDVWADSQICARHVGPAVYPLVTQEPYIFGPKPDMAGGARIDASPSPAHLSVPAGFVIPPELSMPCGDKQSEAADILGGCYDVPGLKEEPQTVLDAGAHVGLFTFWAKNRWANCEVTAYEPEPQNFHVLDHNLRALSGVKLVHSALSNHNKSLKLRKGRNSLTHSLTAAGPEFTAPCTDASALAPYDFIKVDTEGSEFAILSHLDLSKTKAVVCESHNGEETELTKLLDSKGFNLLSDEPTIHGCRLLKFARPEALNVEVLSAV